jgi:hypothetical protein
MVKQADGHETGLARAAKSVKVPNTAAIDSDLGQQLTVGFAVAAAAAVDDLHKHGIAAHGLVDGTWSEIPPPQVTIENVEEDES